MPGKPIDPLPSATALVVEDNEDHALLVRLAAKRVHPCLDVHVVGDGLAALDYLQGKGPYVDRSAHPLPDLVLLDLVMPRLDGFGVLDWIRSSGEFNGLPVVVFTSSDSPADRMRALRLGASAFHTKPADLDLLGEQVRDIVRRWLS